jgi:hypothetical protein
MNQFDDNISSKPNFVLRKERGFGEIIGDSFKFFSSNFKSTLAIFFKFLGPLLLLSVLANVVFQYKIGSLFSDIASFESNFSASAFLNILSSLALYFLVELFLIPFTFFYFTLCIIKCYLHKETITTSVIFSYLKKSFVRYLGFSIMTFFAVFFTAVFSMFFLGLIGGILTMGSPFLGVLVILPLTLAIFIPIVFVFMYFTQGISISIFEDKSVGDALSKSGNLLRNNWWKTLAIYVVFYIIIFVMSYIFQLPSTIYSMVKSFLVLESASNMDSPEGLASLYQDWVSLLLTAIGVIGQNLLSIFKYIMIALVYFNLSEKYDFKGTYDRIENIGK